MSRSSHRLLGGSVALVLALAPVLALAALGRLALQINGSTYESPQFGYVVEWTDAWAALDRHVVSDEGEMDQMQLTNNDGRVWISGYPDDVELDQALEETVARFTAAAEDVEVIADRADADVPAVELTADRDRLLVEVHALDDATVAITLLARERDYENALAAARDGITLNDEAILGGEDESAPEPTAGPDATAEPDATETPREPGPPVLEGNSYESVTFGFSLEIPDGWSVEDSRQDAASETLVLGNGASTVTLLATTTYTGDLPGCIVFARDLLAGDPAYENLRLQSTASGEPFRGSDDRSAYALFSFTGEDGGTWAHYVHCQYIVAGESVLILSQDVPQAEYQAQRAARAAILNAIEIP